MVFIKKPIEEDPRITIRKICERCDVSVGTATRIVRDDLNLREIAARWIALLLTDQQKKQRVECSKDLCSRCLNQMDPNAFATSSQVMRPGWVFFFFFVFNKRFNQMRVAADGKRPVVLRPNSKVRSDCFPFFRTHRVQSHG